MSTLILPVAGKTGGGTVRRWRKKVGETAQIGEVLVEMEGDEGLFEVESPETGQISQIIAKEGAALPAGAPLMILSSGHSETAAPSTSTSTNGDNMKTATATAVIPVLMPQAGQSMEEGTIVKWRVGVGDTIKKGDIIFDIETDKATMEVEATDSGRLARIVLQEGGTIKVLEPVAFLAENDADVDAFITSQGAGTSPAPAAPATQPAAPKAAPTSRTELAPTTDSGRVKASPVARRMARDRGIDLSSLGGGSGPQGRILSTDVPESVARSATSVAAPIVAPATGEGITRKRMSQMRRAIARNLQASKQTIPHFYVKLTVNVEALVSFYQGEKAKYPCSLNDVIVLCCARVISEFPAFRSRLEGEELVTLPTSNIGIAVGMDDGLVVPVLVGAESLTLKQIGAESKRLAVAARAGKIEGMGQGVFTITNLGMFGVEEFSAIINPPEAAILSVGAAREEVIVSGGTLKAGRVMTVVLSADHRIIDGALGAKFLARLKEVLEYPAQLL